MIAVAVVVALALSAQEPSQPSSCFSGSMFAAAPCAGAGVVGGLLLGMGTLFTTLDATGMGDNCLEECVLAVFTAAIVTFGIVLGIAGVIALGPLAAIAVVATAAIGGAATGRNPVAAIVGGLPGVLLGVGGVVVAGVGLAGVTNTAGSLDFLDVSRPAQALLWTGIGLAALAGPVALVGAVGADLLFAPPLVDEPPPAQPALALVAVAPY